MCYFFISENCVFTKLYVPIVTLSTQDDTKFMQPLQSRCKSTSNWDKYQSKVSIQAPSPYLDHLIDSGSKQNFCLIIWQKCRWNSTHRMLSSENRNKRLQSCNRWKKFFRSAGNLKTYDLRTYDDIRKIATDQGDDCLLHWNYFNKYYKTIAIGLSKQQTLEADPKALQHLNRKQGNLNCEDNRGRNINDNTALFSLLKNWKK